MEQMLGTEFILSGAEGYSERYYDDSSDLQIEDSARWVKSSE